jgi:CBS domain containing-hemolysin-like protein
MRELLLKFNEANHSRLPVYRETLDDVVGMIHVKDFMRWMTVKGAKAKTKTKLSSISVSATDLSLTVKQTGLYREVLSVPPSMPATDLLLKMRADHMHLAIVIDEYGGSDGLVTIEDLVEEIVGEAQDEGHKPPDVVRESDGGLVLRGSVSVEKLQELLGVAFEREAPESSATTVAGLLNRIAGHVPRSGERIDYRGLRFEVVEANQRKVLRLRVRPGVAAVPAN